MTPERQRLVEEVFLAAIEAGDEGWARVIDSRCGSDTELRAEVEGLLGCHRDDGKGQGGGVLDRAAPVGQSLLQGFEKVPLGEVPLPPTGKIGHYKISRVLGAGGMGAVYVGEQDRPRRTVALKVIRPGYRSQQVLKRMEHEVELLGRLQHPGIAQIYEAGTADAWGQGSQPFFAMELVDGPTITDYANSKSLSTRERLSLIAGVCDAVQHAHQRGVIHRDIKPGNILVGVDGQPKILDFGVARATANDLYMTMQTSAGQMIGTLPYMSPEQVAADPDQIDTRTDVYALGVVIYELLAGQLPHNLKNRPIPEAARVIRDEQPARLGSVSREFRGEVELIVAKAMEKDKSRRYASAAELAADIRRYLTGQPIWAKRDSGFYVMRKTLTRHKGIAALVALATVLVVGFGVYASVQASRYHDKAYDESLAHTRAESLLKLAQAESIRNETLNNQLQRQLAAGVIERGRLEAVAENGAGAERFLWPALFKDPTDDAAWWALRELYGRFPGDWSTAVRPYLTGVSIRNGLAAVCDRTGGLTVLDADTGQTLASIGATPVVSPNGAMSVTFLTDDIIGLFGIDGVARAYAYQRGKLVELITWQAHTSAVYACQVSPGGDVVATGSADGWMRIWTIPGMTLERSINCGTSQPYSVAFSPDGRLIATGGRDGSVSLWLREDGSPVRRMETSQAPVNALLFSRDGRTIYSGSGERRVDGWRVADGQRVAGLGVTQGDVRRIAYAPTSDGETGTEDRFAVVGTAGLRIIAQAPLPYSRLLAFNVAGFSDGAWNGDRLITVGGDGYVRAWDSRYQPAQTILRPHSSWVFSTEFSPDGKRVATCGGEGIMRMWDSRTGSLLWAQTVDNAPTVVGRVTPRTRMLRWVSNDVFVTGAADGAVRFHNADDGTVIESLTSPSSFRAEVYGLAVSADGSKVAAVATDRTLRVWNAATRKLEWQATDLQTFARGVAFSPDGTKLYSGGSNAGVTVWDTSTHQRIAVLPTSSAPWSIAASPDGKRIGVGTMEAGVDIIELATGTRLGGPSGHLRVVASVVFSPDSRFLFSGGDDGTVKVWEAPNARLLSSIESGLGEVPAVGLSRDGRLLAFGCQGRTAILRDLYYHDRHIAANLEAAIAEHGRDPALAANIAILRRWADLQRAKARAPDEQTK